MNINLNKVITNVKGKAVTLVEPKDVKEGSVLSDQAKMGIDKVLDSLTDEGVKRDVFTFVKDYIVKTEMVIRDMTNRDVLQSVISSQEKPSGKDMVRIAKLLPRLDDTEETLELTEVETEWLVRKILDAGDTVIGSIIKARIFNELDPEGEIIAKYGTDTE